MLQYDILNEIDKDSIYYDPIYPILLEKRENLYFSISQFNQSIINGTEKMIEILVLHADIRSLSANGEKFAAYL